jgi:predicted nucleotidyltransferase
MSCCIKKHGETISQSVLNAISTRYHAITSSINRAFYNIQSDTLHSLYVGSYGRHTAIDASDVDILIELPQSEYDRFTSYQTNGQSQLLQAVRTALISTYPHSEIRADGQVVKINFKDGIWFEVLPAFKDIDLLGNSSFYYPDSNSGGQWKKTNPKAEQDAMKQKNNSSNGLLFDTCKHMRKVRNDHFSSYHLSGIVIDSFVYAAIGEWHWLNPGESPSSNPVNYENTLLNYFQQNKSALQYRLTSPGSGAGMDVGSSICCLEKVLSYIAN